MFGKTRENRRAGTLALTLMALFLSACGSAATAGPAGAQVDQRAGWLPVPDGYPSTAAELNDFERHTRHEEMWDYLEALSGVSTEMRLGSYGETREGRALPYAVFGRPLVAEPWEARTLDRPIVVLGANVHGGERTFREGLLVLMRDLATPGTEANALLDEVVVVVTPMINPDGFEASERGQRGNAWGIDLNRDYVKLEHPSIRNLVENILGEWRPHIFVDGHNGGSRPYNLNYQCTSHYDPAREITHLCDEEIFPAIDARLEAEGLKSWYYQRGDEETWYGGGNQARIGRNYGGFINTVTILFEAPRQELATGARAGYLGYLAVVEYAAENAGTLMGTVDQARMETYAMGVEPRGEIAVEMEYEPEPYPVSYEIMAEDEEGEETGEIVQVTGARLMKRPVATKVRPRPWAYILPRDAEAAVELLRRHDITVERLVEPATLQVDAYVVDDVSYERAYNHAAATRVQVGDVVTVDREFPEGTYVVRTAQFLGRLVAHMLEPETDDNVIYWNTMDAWLPRETERVRNWQTGEVEERLPLVPIYKLMRPASLPAILVEGDDR